MPKVRQRLQPALFPTPVVLVTTRGATGTPNIVTLAWVGVACAEPPMISIAIRSGRLSARNIVQSGEFVMNMPGEDWLQGTDLCGTRSGRDVDKFAATGFTAVPAELVKAPLLAECPVNLECVVRHRLTLGTHCLFVGEVVAVHANSECLDADGHWDIAKMKPFAMCEGEFAEDAYWSMGRPLARHSFTARKQ